MKEVTKFLSQKVSAFGSPTKTSRLEYTVDEAIIGQVLEDIAEHASDFMGKMDFVPADMDKKQNKIFNATFNALIDETIKQLQAAKHNK